MNTFRIPLNDLPEFQLPAGVAAGPGATSAVAGPVFLINCTSVAIASITFDSVAAPQLPPPITAGQPTQPVMSAGSTLLSKAAMFALTFSDGVGYMQGIGSAPPGVTSYSIWCYRNGFVVTTQTGALRQISFV